MLAGKFVALRLRDVAVRACSYLTAKLCEFVFRKYFIKVARLRILREGKEDVLRVLWRYIIRNEGLVE